MTAERVFEQCEECGFDASAWSQADTVAELRGLLPRWRRVFDGYGDDALRRRPAPKTWSAVEYAMHTAGIVAFWCSSIADLVARDVVRWSDEYPDADIFPFNVTPLEEVFASMDSAFTSLADAVELLDFEASAIPLRLADADEERSWHDFGVRDVLDTARHALHDALHHLADVERGFV